MRRLPLTEQDLLKSLRQLNGPVEPDEHFREQLRRALLAERDSDVEPDPRKTVEANDGVAHLNSRTTEEPHPSTTRTPLAAALAAFLVVVLVGVVTFWLAPGPEDEIPLISPPETPSTSLPEDEAAGTTIAFPPQKGRVTGLPGAIELEGPVALFVRAPISPSDGKQSLWVMQPGGQKSQRTDLPHSASYSFEQMTIVGDHILLSLHATYEIGLDLEEPAEQIADGMFLLYPDMTRNRVWIWRGDWFAPFDGNMGTLGERTEVDSGSETDTKVAHPIFAYGDGLVFLQYEIGEDGREYLDLSGDFVYWPSGGDDPEPFNVSWDLDGPWTVSGDVAAIVSRSGDLALVDLRTGERNKPFETGPFSRSTELCFSPDGNHLAVVHPTGSIDFFDTGTGERVEQIMDSRTLTSTMGWVSPDQLVYIMDEEYPRRQLMIFDLQTGSTTPIATLEAPSDWRTGTAGPHC